MILVPEEEYLQLTQTNGDGGNLKKSTKIDEFTENFTKMNQSGKSAQKCNSQGKSQQK